MTEAEYKKKFPEYTKVVEAIIYCKANFMSKPNLCNKKLNRHYNKIHLLPVLLQAEIYNIKGIISHLMDDRLSAITYLKKAKSIALANYFQDLIVKSSLNLSAIYFHLNFTQRAVAELNKVLEFKPGDYITAKVYNNFSVTNSVSENYDEALKYAEKAIEIYKKLNLQNEIIEIELVKAGCYSNMNQNKKALRLFKKVLIYSKKHELHVNTSRCYRYLGGHSERNGDTKKAENYYVKGLKLAKSIDIKEEVYVLSARLIETYFKLEKIDKAELLFKSLTRKRNSKNFSIELHNIYNLKLKHLEKIDDTKGIIKLLKEFNSYLTQYSTIEKDHKLDENIGQDENLILSNRNDKVNQQNDELKQLSFILAHNLKEQVRTINSFANLIDLKYNKQEDSELNEYLGHINDSSKKLYQMMDKAESFIQLELKLPYSKVDLNEIVKKWETKQKIKNIKLKCDPLPIIKSNKNLMILLFSKLLDNSIKFNTKKVKQIKIKFSKTPVHYVFEITDNGIGFEEHLSEKIFEQFYKLDRSDNTGIGEGLPICKKIIRLHNGSISATSKKNKGSTFTFTIPLDFAV